MSTEAGRAPEAARDRIFTVPNMLSMARLVGVPFFLWLVLVEQDVKRAMGVADRVVCLLEGRVTLEGRPAEIKQDALTRAYFGG